MMGGMLIMFFNVIEGLFLLLSNIPFFILITNVLTGVLSIKFTIVMVLYIFSIIKIKKASYVFPNKKMIFLFFVVTFNMFFVGLLVKNPIVILLGCLLILATVSISLLSFLVKMLVCKK